MARPIPHTATEAASVPGGSRLPVYAGLEGVLRDFSRGGRTHSQCLSSLRQQSARGCPATGAPQQGRRQ